jgi:hypothetical protein
MAVLNEAGEQHHLQPAQRKTKADYNMERATEMSNSVFYIKPLPTTYSHLKALYHI